MTASSPSKSPSSAMDARAPPGPSQWVLHHACPVPGLCTHWPAPGQPGNSSPNTSPSSPHVKRGLCFLTKRIHSYFHGDVMPLCVQPQGPLPSRRLSHLESDTGMNFRIIIASQTRTPTTKSLFPALGFCSETYQSCSRPATPATQGLFIIMLSACSHQPQQWPDDC